MRIPGSWTIARPFGVPVRIHWSVPVCAFFAGGFTVAPGAWLAYTLLVFFHEAGHAFVVRRVGARATAIDVLGVGGLCWWEGDVTPLGRACIAWGGIWAQLLVFAITGVAVLIFGRPAHWFAAQMVDVALVSNLWLAGLNLLPIPPLDGKEAWSLFPLLRRRFSRRIDASLPQAIQRSLTRSTSIVILPPDRIEPSRPARASAPSRLRAVAPSLDRREIQDPHALGEADYDEATFTPEAKAVIERALAIAREAAKPGDPGHDAGPSPPREPRPEPDAPDPDRRDGSP